MSSNTSSSNEESSTSVSSSSTIEFTTRHKEYLKAFQKEIIEHKVTKKKLKDSIAKCKKLELNVRDTLSRLSREHQEQKRSWMNARPNSTTIKSTWVISIWRSRGPPRRSDQDTDWWSSPYQVVPINNQT